MIKNDFGFQNFKIDTRELHLYEYIIIFGFEETFYNLTHNPYNSIGGEIMLALSAQLTIETDKMINDKLIQNTNNER